MNLLLRLISSNKVIDMMMLNAAHRRTQSVPSLPPIRVQRRCIRTFSNRTTIHICSPPEYRFYQRYSSDPRKVGGPAFNTHINDPNRWWARRSGIVDHLHWGKEVGQAIMPLRHVRTTFDFYDELHPTTIPPHAAHTAGRFSNEDPSMDAHPHLSTDFSPYKHVFNAPLEANRVFGDRRPLKETFKFSGKFESPSLLQDLIGYSDGTSFDKFASSGLHETNGMYEKENTVNPTGRIPGVHVPYAGEPDKKMMEAMAVSWKRDPSNKICVNRGRYSTSLYLNVPGNNNKMDAVVAKRLGTAIDELCNSWMTKAVVLKGAQSGMTDFFCGGIELQHVAFQFSRYSEKLRAAVKIQQRIEDSKSKLSASELQKLEVEVAQRRSEATAYLNEADYTLRMGFCTIWHVFSAPRPLITLINGRCANIGNGIALYAKYPILRDSTEFIHDGPLLGITPFGGLTHLLSRTETSLKYPGLAEFCMLTCTPLYAGDALRLGWSDLFSTLPDMDFHIRQWFDDTEHMHNDAVAWQLGYMLDSTCKMKEHHKLSLERSFLTPTRARWIEDIFADQPSVEAVLSTLDEVENLSYTDPANTMDDNLGFTHSLPSVAIGIGSLRRTRLEFSLAPWDITPPPALHDQESDSYFSFDLCLKYYFESDGDTAIAQHKDKSKLARWQAFRKKEYDSYRSLKNTPHRRHVFVRLEGCERKLVDFVFDFDKSRCEKDLAGIDSSGDDNNDDDVRLRAVLRALKIETLTRLKMPVDRELMVLWYMPTSETCPVVRDDELYELLHADPGIESVKHPTEFPPVYFIVRPAKLYLSEWAFAVKHQLLMSCPFALKASFQLLKDVRGDGLEENVQSVSESLATEFRFLSRLLRRPDFFKVGIYSIKSMDEWEKLNEDQQKNLHVSDLPFRPNAHFDEVFERNVELNGHKFLMRPKWSPRTLSEVNADSITDLSTHLKFSIDGVPDMHVPTNTFDRRKVMNAVAELGVELVAGLGEFDENGKARAASTESNASVPQNVNFYSMARHPWMDHESSWRQHGYTKGSEEYFEKKYKEAQQKVYDGKAKGQHNYWPTKDEVNGTQDAGREDLLLQDRFWGAIKKAESSVDQWARTTREQAQNAQLNYELEVISSAEKFYDDNYYRWFITPGAHPNPSGIKQFGVGRVFASDDGEQMERKSALAEAEGGTETPDDAVQDE